MPRRHGARARGAGSVEEEKRFEAERRAEEIAQPASRSARRSAFEMPVGRGANLPDRVLTFERRRGFAPARTAHDPHKRNPDHEREKRARNQCDGEEKESHYEDARAEQ